MRSSSSGGDFFGEHLSWQSCQTSQGNRDGGVCENGDGDNGDDDVGEVDVGDGEVGDGAKAESRDGAV